MPIQFSRNDPGFHRRTQVQELPECRKKPRSKSIFAIFVGHRGGTSAVEFALVAGPFFVILFGILELAIIFIVNTGLNVATDGFAKQIRTGQIQAPGLAAAASIGTQLNLTDAVKQLCNQIQIISLETCVKQLQLDVRPLSSFQQTAAASPVSGTVFNSSNLCYYSGNPGDIIEIRGYFLYSFFNPVLLAALSNISTYASGTSSSTGHYFLVQTTQVFKSENFSASSNTGAGC